MGGADKGWEVKGSLLVCGRAAALAVLGCCTPSVRPAAQNSALLPVHKMASCL